MNDVPETRSLFEGFQIRSVATSYSVANGRNAAPSDRGVRREILVANYPLPARLKRG